VVEEAGVPGENMSTGFLFMSTGYLFMSTGYLFMSTGYLFMNNISAISWRPVLVVEEAGVPGENH
jgi:hypothetical protein